MTERANSNPYLGIGIDCGTSGIRAVALDSCHTIWAETSLTLNEQTPSHWWQQTLRLLDDLFAKLHSVMALSDYTIALSIDATSSSLFLLSDDGLPLTPVLMYYDACPDIANRIQHQLSDISGAQGAQSSLVKAIQLSQALNERTQLETHWKVCHQADWLLFQLTGLWGISDENNCLKLGYDSVHQQWEESTLNLIGETHLPSVFAPATPIGTLTNTLCQRWEISTSTQVAAGTTDSIAAFLATGANQVGDAVISLGSTLAFKLLTHRPYFDATKGIYSHRLWQHWLAGGASNAGGAALLDVFTIEKLTKLSQQPLIQPVPLANYYPLPIHRKGERFPIHDPELRSSPLPNDFTDNETFSTLVHGLVDIEQLAWQQLSQGCEQPINHLYACGGGNKNPAWAGLRKSTLSLPHSQPISEQAAVGTAMLALKSLSESAA